MKNRVMKRLVLDAAVAGIFAGVAVAAAPGMALADMRAGGNGCSGKNGCGAGADKAKAAPGSVPASQPASMPAADKHACKGQNACKGLGGCKSGDNGCAGKNSCKGKGGCAVPAKAM